MIERGFIFTEQEGVYNIMDFGDKIESIKGTRDSCTITFNNGNELKCYGELMVYGFSIYKNSLNLTSEEIIRLQDMIDQKAKEYDNPVKIIIE